MTSITIRITEEEKEKLSKYSADNDITMSQIIRKLIKQFLEDKE